MFLQCSKVNKELKLLSYTQVQEKLGLRAANGPLLERGCCGQQMITKPVWNIKMHDKLSMNIAEASFNESGSENRSDL